MKVKELIELLSEYPGDHEVILQKDSEGNGYSPCSGAAPGMYIPETTWCGSFKDEQEIEEERKYLIDMGWEPSDEKYIENSVVIFPIN